MEYKETIFLPKTTFEMRANLPLKEPKILEEWDKENIWEKVLLGLDEIRDDLDEVEGYLETANEYFYEFLREHKVGGD